MKKSEMMYNLWKSLIGAEERNEGYSIPYVKDLFNIIVYRFCSKLNVNCLTEESLHIYSNLSNFSKDVFKIKVDHNAHFFVEKRVFLDFLRNYILILQKQND